jgi:hypothetical protein
MTPFIAITLNVVLDLALLTGLGIAMRSAYSRLEPRVASDALDVARAELDASRPQASTAPGTARRSTRRASPVAHRQARDGAPPAARRATRVGG